MLFQLEKNGQLRFLTFKETQSQIFSPFVKLLDEIENKFAEKLSLAAALKKLNSTHQHHLFLHERDFVDSIHPFSEDINYAEISDQYIMGFSEYCTNLVVEDVLNQYAIKLFKFIAESAANALENISKPASENLMAQAVITAIQLYKLHAEGNYDENSLELIKKTCEKFLKFFEKTVEEIHISTKKSKISVENVYTYQPDELSFVQFDYIYLSTISDLIKMTLEKSNKLLEESKDPSIASSSSPASETKRNPYLEYSKKDLKIDEIISRQVKTIQRWYYHSEDIATEIPLSKTFADLFKNNFLLTAKEISAKTKDEYNKCVSELTKSVKSLRDDCLTELARLYQINLKNLKRIFLLF